MVVDLPLQIIVHNSCTTNTEQLKLVTFSESGIKFQTGSKSTHFCQKITRCENHSIEFNLSFTLCKMSVLASFVPHTVPTTVATRIYYHFDILPSRIYYHQFDQTQLVYLFSPLEPPK